MTYYWGEAGLWPLFLQGQAGREGGDTVRLQEELPGVGQLRQAAGLPLGPARPLLALLGEVPGQQLRVGAVGHLRGRGVAVQ